MATKQFQEPRASLGFCGSLSVCLRSRAQVSSCRSFAHLCSALQGSAEAVLSLARGGAAEGVGQR